MLTNRGALLNLLTRKEQQAAQQPAPPPPPADGHISGNGSGLRASLLAAPAPTPTPTPAPADAPQRLACTTCGETLLNGHFAGQCGPCYRGERLTLPRDPRGRAIVLLRALEAVLPKLPKPESLEDLSVAISDLNECTEGDEATHWLRVGWALLDMIADEVAT